MAGTGKTSKLTTEVAAAPAPAPVANLFLSGVTLRDADHVMTWEPLGIHTVNHGRHAFTNQGGANGIIPVATTVKIYETWVEVSRNAGTLSLVQLINVTTGTVHHHFTSGNSPANTDQIWHLVHDPPIEFFVPANHLLMTKTWINGTFHRLAALYIGTRS